MWTPTLSVPRFRWLGLQAETHLIWNNIITLHLNIIENNKLIQNIHEIQYKNVMFPFPIKAQELKKNVLHLHWDNMNWKSVSHTDSLVILYNSGPHSCFSICKTTCTKVCTPTHTHFLLIHMKVMRYSENLAWHSAPATTECFPYLSYH